MGLREGSMAVNRWQGGGEGVEKQRSREDTQKLTHFAGWLKRIIISTGTPPRARSEVLSLVPLR